MAGNEFWLARELQPILEYATWDKFRPVIEKAITACAGSDHQVSDHFSHVVKMVRIGSGAEREISDVRLPPFTCHLVVSDDDNYKSSSKKIGNGGSS